MFWLEKNIFVRQRTLIVYNAWEVGEESWDQGDHCRLHKESWNLKERSNSKRDFVQSVFFGERQFDISKRKFHEKRRF